MIAGICLLDAIFLASAGEIVLAWWAIAAFALTLLLAARSFPEPDRTAVVDQISSRRRRITGKYRSPSPLANSILELPGHIGSAGRDDTLLRRHVERVGEILRGIANGESFFRIDLRQKTLDGMIA